MKINGKMKEIIKKVGKYKYTGLILLLGIVLMLLPQKQERESESPVIPVESSHEQIKEPSLEEKLIAILQKMDGVGDVDVLLTLETGHSYQYQTDKRVQRQENSEETETETVLITDSVKGEVPVTVSTKYPTYQGALVLCQGADSASVRLQIIQAVSDLTGLGSDRISVIKMKGN